MKCLVSVCLSAACTIAFSSVLTRPAAAQNVIALCANEIAAHCEMVEPGHGRIYACLYANEDKLGEDCDHATADVLDQLDLLFELVRYAKQECREDIQTHCENVVMGGGQIYSCLKAQDKLTPSCGEVMSRISLE